VVAASIFDGITYSKGAATMKQLLLLMGEENFSKGLTSYFKKYGFKNATLEDFIQELQQYFTNQDLTLQEWRKIWLSTASLNQLEPRWNPENLS
jgi:aminopeptidase N